MARQGSSTKATVAAENHLTKPSRKQAGTGTVGHRMPETEHIAGLQLRADESATTQRLSPLQQKANAGLVGNSQFSRILQLRDDSPQVQVLAALQRASEAMIAENATTRRDLPGNRLQRSGGLGVALNDDPGLEREADVMGVKAASFPAKSPLQQKPLVGGQNDTVTDGASLNLKTGPSGNDIIGSIGATVVPTELPESHGRSTRVSELRPVDRTTAQLSGYRQVIQAKLRVGAVNDPLEREAEQTADAVMKKLGNDHLTHSGDKGEVSRAPQSIQRAPAEGTWSEGMPSGGEAGATLDANIRNASNGGHRLDGMLQGKMESAFGADFSGVRIYNDKRADSLNASIQSKAFTHGKDIFFRSGEYTPNSKGGQKTLAHELTHVVQQMRNGESNVREKTIRRDWEEDGDWLINRELGLRIRIRKKGYAICALDSEDEKSDLATLKSVVATFPDDKGHAHYRIRSSLSKKIKKLEDVWVEASGVFENAYYNLKVDTVSGTVDLTEDDGTEITAQLLAQANNTLKDKDASALLRAEQKKLKQASAAKKKKKPKKDAGPTQWAKLFPVVELEYVELLEWAVAECPAALDTPVDCELVDWILKKLKVRMSDASLPGAWIGQAVERLTRLRSTLEQIQTDATESARDAAARKKQIADFGEAYQKMRTDFGKLLSTLSLLTPLEPELVLQKICTLSGTPDIANSYLQQLHDTLWCWDSVAGLEAHFETMLKGGNQAALRGAVPEVQAAAERVRRGDSEVRIGTTARVFSGGTQEVDVQSISNGKRCLTEVKADVSALVVKHLVKTGKRYQLDVLLSLAGEDNTEVVIDCRSATGWARLWYSGYMEKLLAGWTDEKRLTFVLFGRVYSRGLLRKINRIMMHQIALMSFDKWVRREMQMNLLEPIDLLQTSLGSQASKPLTAESASGFENSLKKTSRPRSNSLPLENSFVPLAVGDLVLIEHIRNQWTVVRIEAVQDRQVVLVNGTARWTIPRSEVTKAPNGKTIGDTFPKR